jgi:hypothetical protein
MTLHLIIARVIVLLAMLSSGVFLVVSKHPLFGAFLIGSVILSAFGGGLDEKPTIHDDDGDGI